MSWSIFLILSTQLHFSLHKLTKHTVHSLSFKTFHIRSHCFSFLPPLPSSTPPPSLSFPPFIAPLRSPFFVGVGEITLSSNRSFNNQMPQLNQDAGVPFTFPGWYLVFGKGGEERVWGGGDRVRK